MFLFLYLKFKFKILLYTVGTSSMENVIFLVFRVVIDGEVNSLELFIF